MLNKFSSEVVFLLVINAHFTSIWLALIIEILKLQPSCLHSAHQGLPIPVDEPGCLGGISSL